MVERFLLAAYRHQRILFFLFKTFFILFQGCSRSSSGCQLRIKDENNPRTLSTYALTLFRHHHTAEAARFQRSESQSPSEDGRRWIIDFWDTAGQEQFAKLHATYYFQARSFVRNAISSGFLVRSASLAGQRVYPGLRCNEEDHVQEHGDVGSRGRGELGALRWYKEIRHYCLEPSGSRGEESCRPRYTGGLRSQQDRRGAVDGEEDAQPKELFKHRSLAKR